MREAGPFRKLMTCVAQVVQRLAVSDAAPAPRPSAPRFDVLFPRLMEHFKTVARDALDDDATEHAINFEARVLYGQFLGWTPELNVTVH